MRRWLPSWNKVRETGIVGRTRAWLRRHAGSAQKSSADLDALPRVLLPIAAILTVITLVLAATVVTHSNWRNLKLNELAESASGVANVLAFLWLVVAVLLQYSELRLQRREIADLREASQDQADSLRLSGRISAIQLLMKRHKNTYKTLQTYSKLTSKIIVDYIGRHKLAVEPSEFWNAPEAGMHEILMSLLNLESARVEFEKGFDGEESFLRSLRDDIAYEDWQAIGDIVGNMADTWRILEPLWMLAKDGNIITHHYAYESKLRIRWYAQKYHLLERVYHVLDDRVRTNRSGSELQQFLLQLVFQPAKTEHPSYFRYE